MPIATPLKKVTFKTLSSKCEAIERILHKLCYLHENKIAHRDIKPENILCYDGDYYLADFGLIYIEKGERITKPKDKERIGAKRTIAPEMERNMSFDADKYKADIYSIAKTIWMILVNDYECFEGQYSADSMISLSKYNIGSFDDGWGDEQPPYYTPLDYILKKCTDHNPSIRLSAADLHERFINWVQINNNFHWRNKVQWSEMTHKLFPIEVPNKVEWNNIEDIINVINLLCQYKSLMYVFLPQGGEHIKGVKKAIEDNFIELDLGETPTLFPIKVLTFYSFGNNSEWNYFRLDPIDTIKPIFKETISSDLTEAYEKLTELSPCDYAPYKGYEYEDEYNGVSPTKEMRVVNRYYRGSILLFNTRSSYNLETSTDSRHSYFTKEEFEFYINGCFQNIFSLKYSEYNLEGVKRLCLERSDK